MTIVEFLHARLDEDEREAQVAFSNQEDPEHGWGTDGSAVTPHVGVIHEDVQRAHVAKWHPGRVLADVAAKRAVIDVTFRYEAKIDGEWACCHSADEIRAGVCTAIPVNEIETLRILAAVYADHPDYQQEWNPEIPA